MTVNIIFNTVDGGKFGTSTSSIKEISERVDEPGVTYIVIDHNTKNMVSKVVAVDHPIEDVFEKTIKALDYY
jgi:flavorubredoxin